MILKASQSYLRIWLILIDVLQNWIPQGYKGLNPPTSKWILHHHQFQKVGFRRIFVRDRGTHTNYPPFVRHPGMELVELLRPHLLHRSKFFGSFILIRLNSRPTFHRFMADMIHAIPVPRSFLLSLRDSASCRGVPEPFGPSFAPTDRSSAHPAHPEDTLTKRKTLGEVSGRARRGEASFTHHGGTPSHALPLEVDG